MTAAHRCRFGWLAAGLILIAGCSHRVGPDTRADTRWAYLYGRFVMKTPPGQDPTRRPRSVKFVLRCQDGSNYVFGTTDTSYVQMLRVAPTRCWFVETVFNDSQKLFVKRIPTTPPLQRPLDFAPGRAHYLGDFFAEGDPELGHGFFVSRGRWEMLNPADDRYESTTAEMKQIYPNLERLPTADTRLVPAIERKRTNGVTLAPGEPSLSPDRVAGIAPFIKRNYASPGECEAACPTGQCLPYRSEAGPVIACVTLCNTDKDCPEGLACNCPTGAGGPETACRRIATLPRDPMARICLSVETAGQRR